jgi:zona occludens toxin
MTAVIHHGAPGSYKTFALVQRVMIPALQEGRLVITNVRGFNDIDRIKTALKISIPDTAQIMYLEPDETGYETLARFFHWAPAGALIVMDEGQRVYPTRVKRFEEYDQPENIPIYDSTGQPLINVKTGEFIFRPSTLEIAFDQHRHFNWDIYISTPNIGKIHSEIRKTVEWGYRHRDNSGLLPWYKNTWTEFRHDSEQNGKSVSHYSGTPKRYTADKAIFGCYQSTATGAAKISNENISIFRDPKLKFLFLVILCALLLVGYNLNQAYHRVTGQLEKTDNAVDPVGAKNPAAPAGLPNGADIGQPHHQKPIPRTGAVNPIEGKKIYYTGSINDFDLFEVELDGQTVLSFTIVDLRNFGYVPVRRSGAYVAFDLNGTTVYALSKPRAPIQRQDRFFDDRSVQLGANVL